MAFNMPLAIATSARQLSPVKMATSFTLKSVGVKNSPIGLSGGMVLSTSHAPSVTFPSSYSSLSPLLVVRVYLLPFFFFLFCWRLVSLSIVPLLEGRILLSLSQLKSPDNLLEHTPLSFLDF